MLDTLILVECFFFFFDTELLDTLLVSEVVILSDILHFLETVGESLEEFHFVSVSE